MTSSRRSRPRLPSNLGHPLNHGHPRQTQNTAVILVGFALAAQAMAAEPITSKDAATRIGDTVTVELAIRSAGRNAQFQELYSTLDWKEDACFFVRLSPAAQRQFADLNIPDIAAYFVDETVRVTGKVEEIQVGDYRRPALVLDRIDDIQLVPRQRNYVPTERYRNHPIAGFTLLMAPETDEHKAAMADSIQLLGQQLKAINSSLPKDKLEPLKKVTIWIEWDSKKSSGAEFHPSALWLKQNGRNPDKAGGIEISNITSYSKWSRDNRCNGVLHEIAHAYHFLHIGENEPGIRDAYQNAMDHELYESVPFVDGAKRKAYATTNEKEYFAEISEAYFGRNDFFPFTRDQLKKHDKIGHDLVKEIWQRPVKPRK